ncbi:MAG: hypothetical protein OXD38_10525 [Aestuariivita sp.]|nr:hypothetical protein [Aestuariivita sp.]
MLRHSPITTLMPALTIFAALLCANTVTVVVTLAAEVEETLLVVASADTYAGAGKFTDFLENKSVPYKHVPPRRFEEHNRAQYIVIIIGVNEDTGANDMMSRALDEEERDWLSTPGNNGIYLKQNVWADVQKVMVVAGSSPATAIDSFDHLYDQWLSHLASWFGLSLSREELYGY